jgi:hypothetical protein
MRILFLGRHYTYFRNFESVLRELAERGHVIHAAVERSETFGGRQLIEDLARRYPGITHGEAPARGSDDEWGWTANWLRLGLDYFRYQHPLFADAPKLRDRAAERTPELFVAVSRVPLAGRALRAPMIRILRRFERAIPEDPAVRAYIERQRPDLVLITPLIDLGSSQIDYLRAARTLGIPAALCVWSWDHLSSKALIREMPDRVFVWNETQQREALELHGVPRDRVVVTGAQCFDQWFDRQPSRDRAEFCRQVGLPADRPFLLYVCSALFGGSPSEAAFALDWIRRVRASESQPLATAGILVRPHPSRLAEWEGVDLRNAGPDVVLWGSNPVDAQAKADYFDSLYHSAAVVGLNTSAFIEAAIVGRPVHTILPPEFYENQMGTLHFRYLRTVGGGLLQVADTFDAHLAQLDRSLAAPAAGVSPFVSAFVRPLGIDRRATAAFADGVEAMASLAPPRPVTDPMAPALRHVLRRIGRARERGAYDRWLLSAREYASVTRLRAVIDAKETHRLELVRERDEKRRQHDIEQQQRAQAAAAAREADAARKEQLRREREEKREAVAAEQRRQHEAQVAAKAARAAERDAERRRHAAAKQAARRRERLRSRLRRVYRRVVGVDGDGVERGGR